MLKWSGVEGVLTKFVRNWGNGKANPIGENLSKVLIDGKYVCNTKNRTNLFRDSIRMWNCGTTWHKHCWYFKFRANNRLFSVLSNLHKSLVKCQNCKDHPQTLTAYYTKKNHKQTLAYLMCFQKKTIIKRTIVLLLLNVPVDNDTEINKGSYFHIKK